MQVFAQPVVAHGKAPQFSVIGVGQLPFPSQVATGLKILPVHEAAPQTWLALTLRHAPAPSQAPSVPHSLLAVTSAHWL